MYTIYPKVQVYFSNKLTFNNKLIVLLKTQYNQVVVVFCLSALFIGNIQIDIGDTFSAANDKAAR